MEQKLGHCIKCGVQVIKDRKPTSLWSQRGFLLDNGNIALVSMCTNCNIEPSEYKQLSKILNLDNNIVGVATKDGKAIVDNIASVLKDAQDGKCFYCGKELGDKYAISGGHISCERC